MRVGGASPNIHIVVFDSSKSIGVVLDKCEKIHQSSLEWLYSYISTVFVVGRLTLNSSVFDVIVIFFAFDIMLDNMSI